MEAGNDGRAPEPHRLAELEQELARLQHISAVRVVANHVGTPVEIHVLARPGKQPKQLVRDVQSLAMASFGLRVDRRIVSVVQLGDDGPASAPTRVTPTFDSIHVTNSGLRALVQVSVTTGTDSIVGYAEGSTARLARLRLVAVATLDALHQLDDTTQGLDVEGARIVSVGDQQVVVVTLSVVDGSAERMIAGATIVLDGDAADAAARAVINLATSSTA